jgi:hypothetical protein
MKFIYKQELYIYFPIRQVFTKIKSHIANIKLIIFLFIYIIFSIDYTTT